MESLDDLGVSFRTAEALQSGLTAKRLARLVRTGVLEREAEGRYRRVRPHGDERATHLAAARDLLAVLHEEWHASLRSSALLHGLPLLGRLPAHPQLVRDARPTGTHAEDRFRRVSALPLEHRTVVGGMRSATLARTVVDLARRESKRSGLVVADAALGAGLHMQELTAVLASMRRWPGVRKAREVLAFADGLAESPLESLSRLALHEAGVRPPLLQVEVRLGGTYVLRVDKLWLPEGVVGEDDGLAKFGSDEAGRATSFRTTKQTQDRLEEAGLVFARWGWDDAFGRSEEIPRRVAAALRRARPRDLDPRLGFRLTTVEERIARDARFRRTA